MKKNVVYSVIGGLILCLAFVSCNKDKGTENTNQSIFNGSGPVYSTSLSGFGLHGGYPTGTPYYLPPNIKIVGAMLGGNPGNKGNGKFLKTIGNIKSYLASMPKTNYKGYGLGTYVNVYMKLKNTSPAPCKLVVPPGLIMCKLFNPGDTVPPDTTQSGIIIVPDTIPIPGGDTVSIFLSSFCVNLGHNAPGNTDKYTLKVITNNDQLCKMLGILRYKKTLDQQVSEIQQIIWDITNGAGLSSADISLMNSWK